MSSQADVDAATVADGAPALLGVVDRARAASHGATGRGPSSPAETARGFSVIDGWPTCTPSDVEQVRSVLGHAEPFDIDVRMRRHDGRERWMAMCGAPDDDQVTIISAVDVSASRKAAARDAVARGRR